MELCEIMESLAPLLIFFFSGGSLVTLIFRYLGVYSLPILSRYVVWLDTDENSDD